MGIARKKENFRKLEKRIVQPEQPMRIFNSLLSTINDYIYSFDRDGRFLYANQILLDFFDSEAKEVIGKTMAELDYPKDVEIMLLDAIRQVFDTKQIVVNETNFTTPNGTRGYSENILNPFFDADGSVECVVGSSRDITKRRLAEQALRQRELLQNQAQAQEDERKRIARDLHDELGQQLTVLRLQLESLRKSRENDSELCTTIDELLRIAEHMDDDVDFLAWEIRPASLDDLGLSAALDKYVKEGAYYSGVKTELVSLLKKSPRFASEIEINLYRIAQEALNNTYKHAKAKRVEVILDRRDDSIVLIIADDGTGFNPRKKNHGNGLGLIGMQERVALMGGSIEIESAPNKGTTIYVRVPVQ